MINFLKKLMLFLLLCIGLSIIIIIGYVMFYKVSYKHMPAPALSDSYSLNEKIEFLRRRNKNQHILAMGSSIGLNNLSSETIVGYIQPKTFLNASSWGMNMEDNYFLFKILYEIYHPDTLIFASSISEFEMPSKQVDYELVKKYLKSNNFISDLYYLRCFNLRYYMENANYKKMVTTAKNQYEYLVYDQYGGVNIENENFEIDQQRWDSNFDTSNISRSHYDYLDSIAVFCKLKNVKILFFQSPFRKGVYEKLEAEKLKKLKEHIKLVESILKKSKHTFIDSDKIAWNDSLFLDSEHLSAAGAKIFTTYCFKELDSLKNLNEKVYN